jgi:hypothetical protein
VLRRTKLSLWHDGLPPFSNANANGKIFTARNAESPLLTSLWKASKKIFTILPQAVLLFRFAHVIKFSPAFAKTIKNANDLQLAKF